MIRRLLAAAALSALVSGVAGAASPASPAGAQVGNDDDNAAVAVNTTDGASIFRLAFSVRYVADGVVDQTNTAVALASCEDCRTVALAFQVVLVQGDADTVTPENRALAVNVECVDCLTYASATQIVLGYDGRVRLTGEGHARLAQLRNRLAALGRDVDTVDPNALLREIAAAEQELMAILETEVAPIGRPEDPGDDAPDQSTTTTTMSADDGDGEPSTTTTTDGDDGTEATTTTEPSTTTTTEATTSTTAP